ncbi:MAG: ankyrin repeat domain-containing protein [Myxococcales bacterium]|nr:ankyrin repeat domain-containing protein [Myxococcales bacterium]
MSTYTILIVLALLCVTSCRERDQKPNALKISRNDEALHEAVRGGDLNGVKRALASKANINSKFDGGMNVLHYAALAGHCEMTNYLLGQHADANAKDDLGRTPLLIAAYAAFEPNVCTVRAFISAAANVNQADERGVSPLMGSLDPDISKLLIVHGALVNHASQLGDTALIYAVRRNKKDLVELLLDHGADTAHTNKTGESAVDIARKQGSVEIVDLLHERQKR